MVYHIPYTKWFVRGFIQDYGLLYAFYIKVYLHSLLKTLMSDIVEVQ